VNRARSAERDGFREREDGKGWDSSDARFYGLAAPEPPDDVPLAPLAPDVVVVVVVVVVALDAPPSDFAPASDFPPPSAAGAAGFSDFPAFSSPPASFASFASFTPASAPAFLFDAPEYRSPYHPLPFKMKLPDCNCRFAVGLPHDGQTLIASSVMRWTRSNS